MHAGNDICVIEYQRKARSGRSFRGTQKRRAKTSEGVSCRVIKPGRERLLLGKDIGKVRQRLVFIISGLKTKGRKAETRVHAAGQNGLRRGNQISVGQLQLQNLQRHRIDVGAIARNLRAAGEVLK